MGYILNTLEALGIWIIRFVNRRRIAIQRSLAKRYHGVSTDPAIMGGLPCVKGHRITTRAIYEFASSGSRNPRAGFDRAQEAYPELSIGQISEAIDFEIRLAGRLATPPDGEK